MQVKPKNYYMKEGLKIEEEKRTLIEWMNEHKTELIIAGICFATTVATILALKNRSEIEAFAKDLTKKIMDSKKLKLKTEPRNVIQFPASCATLIENTTIIQPVTTRSKPKLPFDVKGHVRQLSGGRQASPAQIEEAARNGVILQAGQTWVSKYTKNKAAA